MRKQAGMTFIELSVVLFIIGLVTAIALPSFINLLGSTKTGSESRRLVAYIRYMRDMAVRENKTLVLVIDKDLNKYWAATEVPIELMPSNYYYATQSRQDEMRFPPVEDPDGILAPITLDPDLKITKVLDERNFQEYNDDLYKLYINPDGTATCTTIIMEGPNEEYMTIHVKPYTGEPEIYSGEKTMWDHPRVREEEI